MPEPNDLKKVYDKTGIRITGVVKGVNSYTSKKTGETYFSVDLDAKGSRLPINIKLPQGYDQTPFAEYEIVEVDCKIMPTFDKKGIEIHAI